MNSQSKKTKVTASQALHHYYTSILDCMPHLVYWLDKRGMLRGCNQNMKQLLHIKSIADYATNYYPKLAKALGLSPEESQRLITEDKNALAVAQKHHQCLSTQSNKAQVAPYYLCSRELLRDTTGQMIGLIVILMEAEQKNISHRKAVQPHKPVVLDHVPQILIVEDNAIARRTVESLFSGLDCKVDSAESDQDASLLFKPGKYDLVIMDIGLKGTSGYFVTKKFRKLEKKTKYHVPIIALTGHKADRVKFYCNEECMDGAITKPLHKLQAQQLIDHYIFERPTKVDGLEQA